MISSSKVPNGRGVRQGSQIGASTASPRRTPRATQRAASPSQVSANGSGSDGETEMTTLLSDREFGIVQRIVGGYSNSDIAHDLEISEQAVKRHLSDIFKRLGVSSRLELALYAVNSARPG